MQSITRLGIVLAAAFLATPASAGYVVSATIASKLDTNGIDFDYTIVLTDASTSTSKVGTFWYSWLPGKDFMTNAPISEITPNGWKATVTHVGSTDGYAIQWVANTASFDLTPGNSLTFGFTSAETPAQLAGHSHFFPTIPEETSFVYSGRPFSDAGTSLLVSPVPEPSSLILTLLGSLAVIFRKLPPGRQVVAIAVHSSKTLRRSFAIGS